MFFLYSTKKLLTFYFPTGLKWAHVGHMNFAILGHNCKTALYVVEQL